MGQDVADRLGQVALPADQFEAAPDGLAVRAAYGGDPPSALLLDSINIWIATAGRR